MDVTIFNDIIKNLVTLALLYHEAATRFDIDLEVVAFIIQDQFLSSGVRIALINK